MAVSEPAPRAKLGDAVTPGSPNIPPRHAGFVELPERTLRFAAAPELRATAGPARLAYRFAPALDPELPLCVIFSGGPGVTSTMMQRAFGVDDTSSGALSSLCHAVIADQRNSGFSYNLEPANPDEADARLTLADNNTFTDAFDFVWLLLHVLRRYPELSRRPLLILGESYGGVRATLMVDFLLHPDAYARGERKVADDALGARLAETERELELRFAEQLRYQVLVQPVLAGRRQDEASGALFEAAGSPIDQLAAELRQTYTRCEQSGCQPYFNALNAVREWGRSGYDWRAPAAWFGDKLENARRALDTPEGLRATLTVDPLGLDELGAAHRTEAWRLTSPDAEVPDGAYLTGLLGSLSPEDRYFIPFNEPVFLAFSSNEAEALGVDWLDPGYAELFVENARSVATFVTRARYDLVNFSPGLLRALAETSGVSEVELDTAGSEARPGRWKVQLDDGTVLYVRSPEYMAGHGVVGDSGEELVLDLANWVAAF